MKLPAPIIRTFSDASLNFDFLTRYLTIGTYPLQTVAPTSVANTAVVYSILSGGGKVKLMVIFPTGSPVQLAIEP